MSGATERIPILVSVDEKARISEAARAAGLSIGEYLRRAAAAYEPQSHREPLEVLLAQVHRTTASAAAAIDRALAEVAASNERIARMERDAAKVRGLAPGGSA